MLYCSKYISLSVVQTATVEIVPSSKYKYATELIDAEYNTIDPAALKETINEESLRLSNSVNKTQRPKGYFYTGDGIKELIERGEVYVVKDNQNIFVKDYLGHGLGDSNIVVRYFNKDHPVIAEFLDLTRQLGKLWSNSGNKCLRSLIQGKMKHFGTMLGAGKRSEYHYSPTSNYNTSVDNLTNKVHRRLNELAKSIGEQFFPEAVESMSKLAEFYKKVVPEHLGGSNGLCCEMVQSQDSLVTESHVDLDHSLCFSIWSVMSESDVFNCDGWYFVLPHLQYYNKSGEKKGVVVELRHGAAIQWNGRSVFHGSTAPSNKSVNALGTYFGYTVI